MSYLETPDGVPLYYEDRGAGDAVLLVHGWTMNSEYWWRKNVDALADSHRVVTLDLRGHGRSGKTDDGHTLVQYARDVRHLVESFDLNDLALVGWSMGAAVAMTYLDLYGSDRLCGVCFVDQSPKFYSAEDWEYAVFGEFSPEALAGLVENLRANRAETVKPVLSAFFAETPPSETIDEMYAETTQTPTAVAVDALGDMAATDLRHVLPEIDVPVLLVYGEQSAVFPVEVGEWMRDEIPDAELLRFSESGHCPFWEEQERFNDALAQFVARTADRGVEADGTA